MHLHLPSFMVTHDNDRVMSKRIGFHNLPYSLVVGSHPATDKCDCSSRDIIASFQPSVSLYAQDGFGPQMQITHLNDIRLRGTLRGVHPSHDMSARGGDTLVTGEIEVHQRPMDILCFDPGVVIRTAQLNRRSMQDTTYQVRSAHPADSLLLVGFSRAEEGAVTIADIIHECFCRQHTQGVYARFVEDVCNEAHLNAVIL